MAAIKSKPSFFSKGAENAEGTHRTHGEYKGQSHLEQTVYRRRLSMKTGKFERLVWSDEFDGTEIDRSVWSFEKGYVRNQELQCYVDDVDNAFLRDVWCCGH